MNATTKKTEETGRAPVSWNVIAKGLAFICACEHWRPGAREILLDSISDFLNKRNRDMGTLTLHELAELTRGAASAHARLLLDRFNASNHK